MKTITEWLRTLPEPYRSQALNQPEEIRFEYLPHSETVAALHTAIDFAFSWRKTDQGKKYWSAVSERAQAGEFDRPDIDCTIPEEEQA